MGERWRRLAKAMTPGEWDGAIVTPAEKFPRLWLVVGDGKVYKGVRAQTTDLRGSLAGAHATVVIYREQGTHRRTGGQRAADAALVTAVTGSPLGLLAGAYSRPGTRGGRMAGSLTVTFTDAPTWHQAIHPVEAAKDDAERFNILAGTADG